MALPFLPLLTEKVSDNPEERIKTLEENISKLYGYLQDLIDDFPNATGEAIDPIYGSSGDGSLTVDDIPSNITYSPGASLSFDETLFGHVDISATLPARAVGLAIQYKEVAGTIFETVLTPSVNYRLSSLKVGTQYHLKIAGYAANGDTGPFSGISTVTIPTILAIPKAPADGTYIVTNSHASLSAEVLITTVSHNILADLTVGDPHTQYQEEDEKNAASGYAGLNSVSRIIKGVDTTDDVIVDSTSTGVVLKSANGHYWRSTLSDVGVLTWTDLGTTKP